MSDLAAMIFILFTPLTLICGGIFALASALRHRPMARTLRISAAAWFAALGALYAAIIVAVETCGGNMLYGYQNCAILPEGFANLSLPAFLLATAAGVVYGVGMLVLAGVLEWRHRRIARDTVA